MAASSSVANTIVEAGLERVSPFDPGIRRSQGSKDFAYVDQLGQRVVDAETISRIKALAIPPAWRDVWIAPNPLGHIQATGFDAAGRKQYRYHQAWRDVRAHEKFDEVAAFGEMLPTVRHHVASDLAVEGVSHRRVLSCAVRLLELGSFRIGCDRYAVHDDTHGLTTMLARDVLLDGEWIVFDYVGKEHKHQLQHVVDVERFAPRMINFGTPGLGASRRVGDPVRAGPRHHRQNDWTGAGRSQLLPPRAGPGRIRRAPPKTPMILSKRSNC